MEESLTVEFFLNSLFSIDKSSSIIIKSISSIGGGSGMASKLALVHLYINNIEHYIVIKQFNTESFSDPSNDSNTSKISEAYFYLHLAPTIQKYIEIPKLLGIHKQDSIETLLMEYIQSPPWILGEQRYGLSISNCIYAIKTLAKLHCTPLNDLNPSPIHLTSPNSYLSSLTHYIPIFSSKIFTGQDSPEESLKDKMKSIHIDLPFEQVYPLLYNYKTYWNLLFTNKILHDGENSLLHMDYRGENMFFHNSNTNVKITNSQDIINNNTKNYRVLLFDWQNISIGPEVFDLAYLLSGSLSINDRQQYEESLIKLYINEYIKIQKEHIKNNIIHQDNINNSKRTFAIIYEKYKRALLWPVIWSIFTLSGIDELIKSCGKTNKQDIEKAKLFMITGTKRYIQAALDHNSKSLITKE